MTSVKTAANKPVKTSDKEEGFNNIDFVYFNFKL